MEDLLPSRGEPDGNNGTRTYQAAPPPSNKHLSVSDAECNTQVDLEFAEEPLGLSAESKAMVFSE